MAPKVEFRNLSLGLQKMRNFLLGRTYNQSLRFGPELATRSPPLPVLPPGVHEKLAENYYYDRDARRLVHRPQVVFSSQQKAIEGESGGESEVKSVTPGNVYLWDKM